jgi:hypothetical protein
LSKNGAESRMVWPHLVPFVSVVDVTCSALNLLIPQTDVLTCFAEFKEIRKEWKARKKEEENARKAEEERQRAAAQATQVDVQPPEGRHLVAGQEDQQNAARPPPSPPKFGYYSFNGHNPGQYGQPQGGMVYPQGNGQMGNYANYPNSPDGQQGQVYQQHQY